MQRINEIRHYLSSDLNRILQSLYYFSKTSFRSHPTFPLIVIGEIVIVSHSLLIVLMLRLYYNYFIIIYRSQPVPD